MNIYNLTFYLRTCVFLSFWTFIFNMFCTPFYLHRPPSYSFFYILFFFWGVKVLLCLPLVDISVISNLTSLQIILQWVWTSYFIYKLPTCVKMQIPVACVLKFSISNMLPGNWCSWSMDHTFWLFSLFFKIRIFMVQAGFLVTISNSLTLYTV
jgi:hypothetical protein